MTTEKFGISLPRHPLPASSATEPLPPDIADCPKELPETSGVRRASVVLVVAPELGVEGLLLPVHRLMAVLRHHSATAVRPRRSLFFIVRTFTVNFPLRLRAQMCG